MRDRIGQFCPLYFFEKNDKLERCKSMGNKLVVLRLARYLW